MSMQTDDQSGLVNAYFQYQLSADEGLAWAWEAVDLMGFDDPERKWLQILKLLAAAPDDWQIGLLAAGPVEVLKLYGRQFAGMIEGEAASNGRLRRAIGMSWVDDGPELRG
jgi:hypothetical protein